MLVVTQHTKDRIVGEEECQQTSTLKSVEVA